MRHDSGRSDWYNSRRYRTSVDVFVCSLGCRECDREFNLCDFDRGIEIISELDEEAGKRENEEANEKVNERIYYNPELYCLTVDWHT